jgi:hypothetical protein
MDLLDIYLRAVGGLLPKAQRDDIIAELRDMILTRIEGREAELGRPLTESELDALLHEVGHPLVVAARYREGPQHLVGPTLYPYWAFGVKIAIAIQAAIAALVFVIRSLSTGDVAEAFGDAVSSAFSGAISIIGFATLVIWIVEQRGVKLDYLNRWRVRDLRVLDLAFWNDHAKRWRAPDFAAWNFDAFRGAGRQGVGRGLRRRRSSAGQALGTIAGGMVFVLWWIGVLQFGRVDAGALREMGIEPGGIATLNWHVIKSGLFWVLLIYGLTTVAEGVVRLVRPDAVRAAGAFIIVEGCMMLSIIGWLWIASPLSAYISAPALVDLFDHMPKETPMVALAPLLAFVFLVWALAGVIQIGWGTWKALRPERY